MKLIFLFTLSLSAIHLLNAQQFMDWDAIRANPETPIQITVENESMVFKAEPNQALSIELQNQYPNLKSYDLINSSNQIAGKLTIGEDHTLIVLNHHGRLISKEWKENEEVFHISSIPNKACGTLESPNFFGQKHIPESARTLNSISPDNLNFGDELRTYRLAIIGTGEFTAENGGTASSALTTATNTVNGLNLIFGVELSMNLTIVQTQFYTDENTDPFDPNGDQRTNQAAEAFGLNFNDSDYDIGHVFHYLDFGNTSWASGGVAGLGVVCDNNSFFSTVGDSDGLSGPNKGAAWSGGFSNTNNGWIQLVAHEIGHQFDALHTFNGNGNANCNNNISSTSAYEIGSGTTIMSYEGLCSSDQNVPSNGIADNYFHSSSIDRMEAYISSIDGNCASISSNGNSIPQITSSFDPITIPIGTPFELEGSAEDMDNDELLYLWEQLDEDGSGTPTHGYIGNVAAMSTIAPLFKSIPPSSNPIRSFPSTSEILNGQNLNLDFEALPLVSRTLNFGFIAKDQNGGVNSVGRTVDVSDSAGPFEITSQNSSTTWIADGSSMETVTWDVSNTDNALVNCQEVDIWFSTDNGVSFPHLLAQNTSNDGLYTFVIPNLPTNAGRIKIKASNNIFFDINNDIITLESGCDANGASFSPSDAINADQGDPILDLTLTPQFGSVISSFNGTLETSDSPSSLAAEAGGSCVNYNLNTTFADDFTFQVDQAGSYTFSKSSGAFGFVVHLYEGEFFPSSPCTNWLAGSFNTSTSLLENSITYNLNPGIQYTLVIAGFNASLPSGLPQNYSYTCSGTGNCISGDIAPAGFDYIYVIVDTEDNTIVEFAEDPDLTSFAGGEYQVYGFSIESTANVSIYINGDFSDLISDILDLTLCGSISANQLDVTIFNTACLGDFNSDGSITAADLTIFLSNFGCLSNCVTDLNGDDSSTAADLTVFLSLFGTICP